MRKTNYICAVTLVGMVALSGYAGAAATSLGAKQSEELAPFSKNFTRLPLSWKALDKDKANARRAWQIITDANKDAPQSDRKLHVVYVTFADRPALDGYKERYDHILKNIQAYYADQMKENGFPSLTFALDLDKDGKLVIHEAHVDKNMSEVNVNSSGPVSRQAAVNVLREKGIDPDRNHILVVCQLEDGVGPYYGGGSTKTGTGWTCDQADLDPRNFLSTKHFGGRYNQTVGGNATIYIGGTAHELGHAFGMPHTCQGWEYPDSGTSLMGSGNHTYGQDLRKESKGSFLVPTDALMLASVPLFNGIESKGEIRWDKQEEVEYSDMEVKPVPFGAIIKGKVKSKTPCYAVVVHLDPPGGDDYDANAVAGVPDKNGNFSLEIKRPGYSGFLGVRVTALLTDGNKVRLSTNASLSDKGLNPQELLKSFYFSEVVDAWSNRDYDKATKLLKEIENRYGNVAPIKETISMWKKVLANKAPDFKYPPSNAPAQDKTVSLVDCNYIEAKAGWGVPCWDVMLPSELGPQASFIDGGNVDRFIMIHAVGVVKYDLGGKWSQFSAQVGVPCGKGGSIRYKVFGDGNLLFSSKTLRDGQSVKFDLNVEGVKELEIQVDDSGDGNFQDWGIIGNPTLKR